MQMLQSQTQEVRSLRNLLATLPKLKLKQAILSLTEVEAENILYDWELWARENQLTPSGNWTYWLILAGRGFGKTRTGAEWVRQQVKTNDIVNLIGATVDDARDVMIEGESGILAVCPKGERPDYKKSSRQLHWPNGAKSLIFTADQPERLRGKQHKKLWADELAAWRYPKAWDQAMLGLRLGKLPQAVITTTPKPTQLIKELLKDLATYVTKGTTYDNQANLAVSFFKKIITKYENTRLGRQELNAEILEDNPNALWQRARIDELRVSYAPQLKRVIVAVDPAVSNNEKSNETGIIVAGLGVDNEGYVLADRTLVGSPGEWADAVFKAYDEFKADAVIAETNNGGDLVEANLRAKRKNFAYKKVHASRGKAIRAEPVASLDEQGRVHHVGLFAELEDQMCDFNPLVEPDISPDRMDARVWAFWELFNLGEDDHTGMLDYYAQRAHEAKEAQKITTELK